MKEDIQQRHYLRHCSNSSHSNNLLYYICRQEGCPKPFVCKKCFEEDEEHKLAHRLAFSNTAYLIEVGFEKHADAVKSKMLEVKSKVYEARCAIETIRERKETQINDIDDEYEKIEEVLVGNLQNLMRYFRSEAKLKA